MGGPSSEHEVSLETGREVLENLDAEKYCATPVVIDKRGLWLFPGNKSQPLSEPEGLLNLRREKIDLAFIAMHGEYGEDGTVQSLLTAAGIPHTGSNTLPSALAMHKPLSSRALKDAGLNIPDFKVVHYLSWSKKSGEIVKQVLQEIGLPAVVKPASRGSSVGLTLVREFGDLRLTPLRAAIDHAFGFGKDVVIQKYISGKELACGVIEYNGRPSAMLPTEIIPLMSDIFDYASKYSESGAEEITPPQNMDKATVQKIQTTAIMAHQILGCTHYSRTDMILGHDKKLYVLEVNSLPGLTRASLLPKAALASGIKFPKLLDLIVENVVLA